VANRYIDLRASPLAPGTSPVRIHYRDVGSGPPLMVLHGGWGYDIYPFDRQIAALAPSRRIVIPDRSGYGASGRLITQEIDFHRRAAEETFAVIAALALDRPILWGHSDGAVIALLMGLAAPARVGGLILEATHLFRCKPASRTFFELMRDNPDGLGERVTGVLAREHGDAWRHLISANGDAWLRLAEQGGDLYDGRLSALQVPVLVIHGARDPRTEPGELDVLRQALAGASPRTVVAHDVSPAVRFEVLLEGGHSPHSAPATADEVTRAAAQFVSALGAGLPGSLDLR
jgi:pimeloyl-ACP methyl ester carboxylesterase